MADLLTEATLPSLSRRLQRRQSPQRAHRQDLPLCAVCQDGYTQASDLTCLICPTMAETVAQNLGVICGVVVGGFLLSFLARYMNKVLERMRYVKGYLNSTGVATPFDAMDEMNEQVG